MDNIKTFVISLCVISIITGVLKKIVSKEYRKIIDFVSLMIIIGIIISVDYKEIYSNFNFVDVSFAFYSEQDAGTRLLKEKYLNEIENEIQKQINAFDENAYIQLQYKNNSLFIHIYDYQSKNINKIKEIINNGINSQKKIIFERNDKVETC